MAIWERIWRANCAVAVFGGHAGTANRVRNGNAAQEGDCTKARAAHLSPRQANRTGVSISSRDRRRLARRPCSCCPARHPARILVLRWSAQDAAAEPYEYALDCASDRKAYAWAAFAPDAASPTDAMAAGLLSPIPLADIVLWEAIVRAGKRKGAGASARAA